MNYDRTKCFKGFKVEVLHRARAQCEELRLGEVSRCAALVQRLREAGTKGIHSKRVKKRLKDMKILEKLKKKVKKAFFFLHFCGN